jgi:hypothetical protein
VVSAAFCNRLRRLETGGSGSSSQNRMLDREVLAWRLGCAVIRPRCAYRTCDSVNEWTPCTCRNGNLAREQLRRAITHGCRAKHIYWANQQVVRRSPTQRNPEDFAVEAARSIASQWAPSGSTMHYPAAHAVINLSDKSGQRLAAEARGAGRSAELPFRDRGTCTRYSGSRWMGASVRRYDHATLGNGLDVWSTVVQVQNYRKYPAVTTTSSSHYLGRIV